MNLLAPPVLAKLVNGGLANGVTAAQLPRRELEGIQRAIDILNEDAKPGGSPALQPT